MSEPRTEAGRLTLIGFGVGRLDYPGRDDINDQLRRAILSIEAEAGALDEPSVLRLSDVGWWHPAECIDIHDEDHNCRDANGAIIGWREWAAPSTEPDR